MIKELLSVLRSAIVFLIILITLIFATNKYNDIKTQHYKLKKWSTIFKILGIIVIIFFGFFIFLNNTDQLENSIFKKSDGFTIEEYKIIMDVNEANIVDVKEYITVNFYEENHHGIYRFIPSWLKYTNKDGITESRQAKISDLKAMGELYTLDTINGKGRIKIGDPNTTIPIGNHKYEIHYRYDMGFDPYDSYDEFIFHAFGDYWGTEINNASITINLPKELDKDKIKFFADKYRKKDITEYIDYNINGNTIYAKLSPNYKLYNFLTIDIELPNNYFVNGNNNYGNKSLILCSICIIITLITFILWIIKGKDLEKVPETIEFYPPKNLDAADIGYLYKNDTSRKLTIALIIELASKGFIKIIELEDKKTETIVKSNTTDINKYIKREIKIKKIKEYKAPFFDNHYNATQIMKEYFSNNINNNTVKSNFDEFYENSKFLIENGYIEIESDTINNYSKEECKKIQKKLLKNEFKDKTKMTDNEKIVYDKLFEEKDEIILSSNYSFYKVFNDIVDNIRNKFDDKINDLTTYKYMLITSFGFFISSINLGLACSVLEDLNPKYKYLYLLTLISIIITFIFTILMKRRNNYGEQIKSKINGFKNYIESEEKNKFEKLASNNPNYFYNILPYAYVLGISKKWIEKFENIPTPTKDMGNFNYYDTKSLDNLSDSVYIPTSSSSSSGY